MSNTKRYFRDSSDDEGDLKQSHAKKIPKVEEETKQDHDGAAASSASPAPPFAAAGQEMPKAEETENGALNAAAPTQYIYARETTQCQISSTFYKTSLTASTAAAIISY